MKKYIIDIELNDGSHIMDFEFGKNSQSIVDRIRAIYGDDTIIHTIAKSVSNWK